MADRHLLLQPRWVVASVIIVVCAVTFTLLGRWQLQRLGEVREQNALVAERFDQPPLDLAELAGDDLDTDDADALEHRRVTATGTYLSDDEVLQRSRAHRGQNGFHVLTPLELDDGSAVLVRRGWVPLQLDDPPVAEGAPPAGEVTVTGFLQRSEPQRTIGPTDPDDGELELVFRADVGRIDRQVDAELFPLLLQLEEQTPAQDGRLPVPAERPALDEGNHLSYALQWFSFAAIAVVGYAAVLRKRTREDAEDQAEATGRSRVS